MNVDVTSKFISASDILILKIGNENYMYISVRLYSDKYIVRKDDFYGLWIRKNFY